jgi:hypothetical protein
VSAAYWEVGRRIVEFEQAGRARADYGERIIDQLSIDLGKRHGRGFGRSNLFQIRAFYLAYREKVQTVSGQLSPECLRDAGLSLQLHQLLPTGMIQIGIRRSLTLPWMAGAETLCNWQQ